MYLVITDGSFAYAGNDVEEAYRVFDSKENSSIHKLKYEDKQKIQEMELEITLGDALENLLQQLNSLNFDQDVKNLAESTKDAGKKVAAEVRAATNKGMKAVGEKFVALGELLKKEK